ncbi:MAG: hypothetical protein ACJ786_00925, partial [Catenulispora sp.]
MLPTSEDADLPAVPFGYQSGSGTMALRSLEHLASGELGLLPGCPLDDIDNCSSGGDVQLWPGRPTGGPGLRTVNSFGTREKIFKSPMGDDIERRLAGAGPVRASGGGGAWRVASGEWREMLEGGPERPRRWNPVRSAA